MAADPYEAYLRKAERLFEEGDVFQAGQIWQAIVKKIPDHAEAWAGLNKVKALYAARGVQAPVAQGAASQARSASSPTASVAEPPALEKPQIDSEEADRLIRDGCTLYDMGMTGEAIEKWEKLLQTDPGHVDAKAYLEMAKRDLQAAPPAPPPPPTPTSVTPVPPQAAAPPAPPPPPPPPTPLPQAPPQASAAPQAPTIPIQIQMESEASPVSVKDFIGAPIFSRSTTKIGAPAKQRDDTTKPMTPTAFPEARPPVAPEESTGTETAPVVPPKRIQVPGYEGSRDRSLPDMFRRFDLDLPRILRRPTVLMAMVGGILVLYAAVFWLRSSRKDAALREMVAAEKAQAQIPAAKSLEQADLREDPAGILREAEYMLDDDPFISYFRAKELVRLSPLDSQAAKLMQKASVAWQEQAGKVQNKNAEELIKSGNLEGGEAALMSLLAQNPEDAEMRDRLGRLLLSLATRYAEKANWKSVEIRLKRGRAMYPQDKGWNARLTFLESLKGMNENDRKSWAQFLG